MGICFYTAYGGIICTYIPSQVVSVEGEDLSTRLFSPSPVGSAVTVLNDTDAGRSFAENGECVVKLCGLVPLKTVPLKIMPALNVVPGGNVIGINVIAVHSHMFHEVLE